MDGDANQPDEGATATERLTQLLTTEGRLFELLDQLIAPGPGAPFGELGLEGFLQEFWAGFRGADDDGAARDWTRLRRFSGRFLSIAAMGRLIARVRFHAERAVERTIQMVRDDSADPTAPVLIDAAFVRAHGVELVTALVGAFATAVAEQAEPDSARGVERARLKAPWRIDVFSVAKAALDGAVATGRNVAGRAAALLSDASPQDGAAALTALVGHLLPALVHGLALATAPADVPRDEEPVGPGGAGLGGDGSPMMPFDDDELPEDPA
jgi:hypothetical protein